jgi:hypothetical protein
VPATAGERVETPTDVPMIAHPASVTDDDSTARVDQRTLAGVR